jgi:glucan-binding YG repeat protein
MQDSEILATFVTGKLNDQLPRLGYYFRRKQQDYCVKGWLLFHSLSYYLDQPGHRKQKNWGERLHILLY